MSNGEPAHYICTNCYQQSKKSVLSHMQSAGGLYVITCSSCNAKMGIQRGYVPPSYVMTEQDRIRAALEPCAICATGRLKVTHVGRHPVMGDVGLQEQTLTCVRR